MKKKIGVLVFSLLLILPLCVSGEEKGIEELFSQGKKAYQTGEYGKALSIFKEIGNIDPTYKKEVIKVYKGLAASRKVSTPFLRRERTGVPKVLKEFEVVRPKEKKVRIKEEPEWETLTAEVSDIILETGTLIDKVLREKLLEEIDLLSVRNSFKRAEKAYRDGLYVEAIRLANKAKGEIEILLKEKEPKKKLLGEIGDKKVTLNLSNSDLQDTLKLIYDLTGVNIVLSSGIKGKVNMNVTDVPLRQVLDLIVDANGLKYIEREGVIRIMTPEEYEKTREAVAKRNKKSFLLQYGDAKTVARVIKETLRIEGVTYDERTNSVIVDLVDSAQADEVSNLIQGLDIPANQVLIEAKLIEVSLFKEHQMGIDWLVASKMIDKVTITGPKFGDVPGSLPTFEGVSLALSHADVNALITALAKEGEVRILQSPRIMTLSGTSASIQSMTTIKYPGDIKTTWRDVGGGVTRPETDYTIEELEVGISFNVVPRILPNETVSLVLEITESKVVAWKEWEFGRAGEPITTTQPETEERFTTQNVILWEGETLIVGGIIAREKRENITKVPFLGNIPLLGHLFKRTTYEDKKREMILFLTPYIIKGYRKGKETVERYEKETEVLKERKPGLIEKF